RDHDREWRFRDVTPTGRQFSEPTEHGPIANHDEVPGLPVHPAARETPCLDDPPHDGVGYRGALVAPDGEQRANGLEDVPWCPCAMWLVGHGRHLPRD